MKELTFDSTKENRIRIMLDFSEEQILKFFHNAKLETKKDEKTEVWMVVCPYTGKEIIIYEMFANCIQNYSSRILSEITQVEIYNSFKK